MRPVDARIGEIAGRQDNVISLAQLADAGLSRKALHGRLAAGAMQRMHQAVFLVGPAPPSFAAVARAAAFAVGDGATVGLGAAAILLKLRSEPAGETGPVDVLVDRRSVWQRSGIVVHRTTIVPAEWGYVRGIPVTSPARTICDLAAVEPMYQIEQLLIDARRARCVTDRQLYAVLDRVPHRKGHGAMRALLADEMEEGYSRSAAERRLRKLIKQANLPVPIYNHKVRGLLVDADWARVKFIVEVDGRKEHDTDWAYENDRLRDQILAAGGYRVVRITWRQLVNDPMGVAVRIAQALVWAERAA